MKPSVVPKSRPAQGPAARCQLPTSTSTPTPTPTPLDGPWREPPSPRHGPRDGLRKAGALRAERLPASSRTTVFLLNVVPGIAVRVVVVHVRLQRVPWACLRHSGTSMRSDQTIGFGECRGARGDEVVGTSLANLDIDPALCSQEQPLVSQTRLADGRCDHNTRLSYPMRLQRNTDRFNSSGCLRASWAKAELS